MYDALFTPLEIAGRTIPHRVVRTAHNTGLGGEELIAYHVERAKGGVGLSILQAAGVQETSITEPLPVHCDDVIPTYQNLSKRVHEHGMLVFQQLYHKGSAFISPSGVTHWSSSPVPDPVPGIVPHAMGREEIADLITAFVASARRVRLGGLDGLEIHAAHGYILHQFLSPALNHRDDEYGGSFENRMRLLLELIDAIRAEVGHDFPVGMRLSVDDCIEGGIRPYDAREIALAVDDKIDFLDLSTGSYWRHHRILAGMETSLGYQLKDATVVSEAVLAPTIVAGRIMTLVDAEQIVASGQADMVSMVRALIADPYLIKKATSGQGSSIRPCIGSNTGCVGNLLAVGRMGCTVNVAAGRETELEFDPSKSPLASKRVMVIGGGPAGMEAARTLALRGHEVVLYEARRDLGGQLRIAATVPGRSDLLAIAEWLREELGRLDVLVRRNTFADVDTVRSVGPDHVVVATGSEPDLGTPTVYSPMSSVRGSDLPHVYTSWQILGFGGMARLGKRVVIYDDTGTFEAMSVAVFLVEQGYEVVFLTRHDSLGAQVKAPSINVTPFRERLYSGRFQLISSANLVEVTPEEVRFRHLGTDVDRAVPANNVVIVNNNRPNREVSDQLKAVGVPLHMVGDVNGAQSLEGAILEASTMARAL